MSYVIGMDREALLLMQPITIEEHSIEVHNSRRSPNPIPNPIPNPNPNPNLDL